MHPYRTIERMRTYRSVHNVTAGKIVGVNSNGVHVKHERGLLKFFAYATHHYMPSIGDFFMIDEDGVESVCPRDVFEMNYNEVCVELGQGSSVSGSAGSSVSGSAR